APVNNRELNVCLVGRAAALPELRRWAAARFDLPDVQTWRTITPLTRRAISPVQRDVFFIGDAARVVEPFTGEGIFYALNSGEIAAEIINRLIHGAKPAVAREEFRRAYARIYRRRLWINKLARAAVVSPRVGSFAFAIARRQPRLLNLLTGQI